MFVLNLDFTGLRNIRLDIYKRLGIRDDDKKDIGEGKRREEEKIVKMMVGDICVHDVMYFC